jgi:hypothetical protein
MRSRAAAWFTAIAFLFIGAWVSYEGWQKKWNTKGITWRLEGAASLLVGGFCAATASRR